MNLTMIRSLLDLDPIDVLMTDGFSPRACSQFLLSVSLYIRSQSQSHNTMDNGGYNPIQRHHDTHYAKASLLSSYLYPPSSQKWPIQIRIRFQNILTTWCIVLCVIIYAKWVKVGAIYLDCARHGGAGHTIMGRLDYPQSGWSRDGRGPLHSSEVTDVCTGYHFVFDQPWVRTIADVMCLYTQTNSYALVSDIISGGDREKKSNG